MNVDVEKEVGHNYFCNIGHGAPLGNLYVTVDIVETAKQNKGCDQ